MVPHTNTMPPKKRCRSCCAVISIASTSSLARSDPTIRFSHAATRLAEHNASSQVDVLIVSAPAEVLESKNSQAQKKSQMLVWRKQWGSETFLHQWCLFSYVVVWPQRLASNSDDWKKKDEFKAPGWAGYVHDLKEWHSLALNIFWLQDTHQCECVKEVI